MNITTYKSSDMRRALCLGGLLSMLCVMPLWADPDIANNVTTPSCDDSVLNTDTGPADIEINWAPNHITLNWYEDSSATTPMTVGTASRSCDYDGTLTIPAAPAARTGYTFKGWRVRQAAQCSFTSSEVSSMSGVNFGYTSLDGSDGFKEAQYGLTTPGEWAIEFNTGIMKGMAKCSSTNGNRATPGTPSDTNGQYCWCQATNYTPNGGNQCNVSSSSWGFSDDFGDAGNCAISCAGFCPSIVQDDGGFRRAVFGVSQ